MVANTHTTAVPAGHVFFYMNATASSLEPTSAMPPWTQRRCDLLDHGLGPRRRHDHCRLQRLRHWQLRPQHQCRSRANRGSDPNDHHADGRGRQSQLRDPRTMLVLQCRGRHHESTLIPGGHVFFYMNATATSLGPISAMPPWTATATRPSRPPPWSSATTRSPQFTMSTASATSPRAPVRPAQTSRVPNDHHADGLRRQSKRLLPRPKPVL